jgi:hypothetical protein
MKKKRIIIYFEPIAREFEFPDDYTEADIEEAINRAVYDGDDNLHDIEIDMWEEGYTDEEWDAIVKERPDISEN